MNNLLGATPVQLCSFLGRRGLGEDKVEGAVGGLLSTQVIHHLGLRGRKEGHDGLLGGRRGRHDDLDGLKNFWIHLRREH